jgi:leader peptidase (prepilin peptidase)/N-methyltransferase
MLSDVAALYTESPALFAGSVFLVGLVVGSFLNVVIYRLPIILEREWRAQAAELTAAREAPISIRDPLVELATGILSAWAAWHFGFGAAAACAVVVTWALIALTGIDIDHQLLPDSITLPLLWAGLLAAVVIGHADAISLPVSPRDAIIGAAAGYLSLWLVYHAFRLITGKEGMGYGDFKLFAALGAWMGWKLLPLIILLSAATGAVLGLCMIALRGRDRAAPMPFGPYLAAAGWLAMMYGEPLMNGYLRLSGLQR